jgi:hypothetical protein
MAKYKLTKPCYVNSRLYKAGEVVDFGDQPAPKGSIEVAGIVEKAKAAVAAKAETVTAEDAAKEDALLKSKK